ncbi:MAG: GNAT family N-acetyltransferase [Actinomycetota bacterium]|nr:GNAT family N-acetyltransferase [Actinomycetota bacterium]
MPKLVVPHTGVHASFVDAMTEFASEGRGNIRDDSMIGHDIRTDGGSWAAPEVFATYVQRVVADADPASPRPDGFVPSTTLWWVEDDTYLARIAVRHSLTPWLLEQGGHVGYDVRPSARRRGHATAMLRASLPVAAGLGIERLLITCDHDNVGSRKVIEACGGALEDRRADKLRYWVVPAG